MTTQTFSLHLNTIPQKLQIQGLNYDKLHFFICDFKYNLHIRIAQNINTVLDLDFHVVSVRFALIQHPVVHPTNAIIWMFH